MTDAFNAAILANPRDETHRLVFADYLDENENHDLAAALRDEDLFLFFAIAAEKGLTPERALRLKTIMERMRESFGVSAKVLCDAFETIGRAAMSSITESP